MIVRVEIKTKKILEALHTAHAGSDVNHIPLVLERLVMDVCTFADQKFDNLKLIFVQGLEKGCFSIDIRHVKIKVR